MSSAFYDIQYKASSGQVNLDQAQGIVECFVAGIGNKDSVGDVCATGAFTKSLMRRKPRVVWGHNWNDPIGKVLEIYEVPASDPRLPSKMRSAGIGGLYAKVQFNLNSEKGREAFANVAFFGEEQEWSIGYKTLRAQFDPGIQANILYEVELYEVSPVLHGANQLTGTISVKSDEKGGMMPMMVPPMEKPSGNEPEMQEDVERKLQEELSARLGTPIKVLKTQDGVVYFTRGESNNEGPGSYKCRYHMGDDGVFMFGRPERFMPPQVAPIAKPVQRMPMGMPSKPMAPTPGAPPVVVPSLVPGANPMSPPMVRFNFNENGKPSAAAQEKPRLVDEERDLAEALLKITKKYGKFNEDSTGVWAGYKPAAENPVAKIGVKCANCVMFEGDGKCKIIDKQVEPEGKCRFAIIPEGVVSMGPIQKMNYDIETEEEEVKWVEDIEAKYPGEFVSGVLRNVVKRRRKRRMMGRKVFRIDEYQEKSLEDFSDMDTFDVQYVLPVNADEAFKVKELIDPIIDYHMVDATVEDGGIVFTGGVTQDFVEAVGVAVSRPFLETEQKALGRNLAGRMTRTTRGLTARFDPNAWDGDNDGVVQEGTPYERPAIPGVNDFASRGKVNKRAARQAWKDYKRQGKPAIEKRPKEIAPSSIQYDETGMAMEGAPFQRGLSSGAKLSPPRAINPTSQQLDDSINKQDYDWGIDKIVDDFGNYLDELDPDELQDAYEEILSQMKMDKMKAKRDGILEDDVMGDDFTATAKRLAKELDLDEADAEDEAGRLFDARDKYRVRTEQYKAAEKDIKRRLRKTPSSLRTRDRDRGLASGGRTEEKSKVDEIIDGLDDYWDAEDFYKQLQDHINTLDEDELDDFLSELQQNLRDKRRAARLDGLESDEVSNADVDALAELLESEYDMTPSEAAKEAERLIDDADKWVAVRDYHTGAIEEVNKKLKAIRSGESDGLASGRRSSGGDKSNRIELEVPNIDDPSVDSEDKYAAASSQRDELREVLDSATDPEQIRRLNKAIADLDKYMARVEKMAERDMPERERRGLASGRSQRRHSDRDAKIESQFPNPEENAKREAHEKFINDWEESNGLPFTTIDRQPSEKGARFTEDWMRSREIGYNDAKARWAGNGTSKQPQRFNENATSSLDYATWFMNVVGQLGREKRDRNNRTPGDGIDDNGIDVGVKEFLNSYMPTTDNPETVANIQEELKRAGFTADGDVLAPEARRDSERGLASGSRGESLEQVAKRIFEDADRAAREDGKDFFQYLDDAVFDERFNGSKFNSEEIYAAVAKLNDAARPKKKTRREARRDRIAKSKPREGVIDEKTEAGRTQLISDTNKIGIDKFDSERGLASGGSRYPSDDDPDEVWEEWINARAAEREARGIRPYGDELAYGFMEDMADGKLEGTERSFIKDDGQNRALISYQNEQLDDVLIRVIDPENMEEDLAVGWYMSRERDATPRTQRQGWYINRLVFDDYEGYFTDEYDYDFSYAVGPFDSPEAAAEHWEKEGKQRDERVRKNRQKSILVNPDGEAGDRGLASGKRISKMIDARTLRRKYSPRYESSKKLADLMDSSPKPRRSDYDYSQDSDIIPTEEQKDIIDAVMEGADVVVGALAGTGKTSTLVSLARRLKREDRGRKVIYLAFNKSAAQDARRRFKGTTVQVMTMDALSYNWYEGLSKSHKDHIGKRFSLKKGATGTPTTRRAIAQRFKVKPYVYTDVDGEEKEISAEDIARMAIDAVERFETSADTQVDAKHFGKGKGTSFKQAEASDIPPGAVELAKKIWASKTDRDDPYGVQISNTSITKMMALENPSLADGTLTGRNVDMAMIDEAQDLNPVFSNFIRGQEVQKVTVGDPNQAIYGFRGAKNEMDVMGEAGDYVLPLTEVFRFGPEIATAGNKVLALFNILTGRMVGKGKSGEIVERGTIDNPDMILARTNAGVIKEAFKALEQNKVIATTERAYDELESFIDSWKYLIGSGDRKRPKNMHADLAEYESIKELADDVQKDNASQKAKTLFQLGSSYRIEELERLLGKIYIWDPASESGEDDEINMPEDFEVGDLGVVGPATYEVFDDKIVLNNSYQIKDYALARGWRYDPKAKSWSKKATTQQEREDAMQDLVDALNNGVTADIPESFKNGDTGELGKVTWVISGNEMIFKNPKYDKSGDLRKKLETQGWKLRKDTKTGKWEYYQRLTGDAKEDRDTFEYASGLVSSEGALPKFSQQLVEAADADIVERAKVFAASMSPDDKDREILLNVIDFYERNGWARRKGWERMQGAAKRRRIVPPIDTRILTAHLSKGLEANNVKLADDFWGPKRKKTKNPLTGEEEVGDLEWPEEEHMKVIYVALTRARRKLDMGSAEWINEYTDDDDGLPNDPEPDKYNIPDGEEGGLASGGRRGRRARKYQGREVSGNPKVGGRPWSEEERQAFRDGVRMRAQTIPGKRRSDQEDERGLSSGRRQAESKLIARGLASGGTSDAGNEEEPEITEAGLEALEASINEARADAEALQEARSISGEQSELERLDSEIETLQEIVDSRSDAYYENPKEINARLRGLKNQRASLMRAQEGSSSASDGGGEEAGGGIGGARDSGPDYDSDDTVTTARRRSGGGGSIMQERSQSEQRNKGFGVRDDNTRARTEYEEAKKEAIKQKRAELKESGMDVSQMSQSELLRDYVEFPTYNAWRISKGYPEKVFKKPGSATSTAQGDWLEKTWKKLKSRVSTMGSNDGRDSSDVDAPWMLSASKLKNLFKTNTGEQMTNTEIAEALGISEADVEAWDAPGAGIERSAVEDLIETREKEYGKEVRTGPQMRAVDMEIEEIWGYESKPFWAFFEYEESDGPINLASPGTFRLIDKDEYEESRRNGDVPTSFMADPNSDPAEGEETKLTEQEQRKIRTDIEVGKTTDSSSRANFPVEFLARSLGWIKQNESVTALPGSGSSKDASTLKKLRDSVYDEFAKVVDITRASFDKYLKDGIPSEIIEELIDAGIVPGYESVARPDIAIELAKNPSPDRAKSAVEKYLKDIGLSEEQIRPIFNTVFTPEGKDTQKVLYNQYLKKKESAAKRRQESGGKIKPSGSGGTKGSKRVSISDAEAEYMVSQLNERLAKLGKDPVTREQVFGTSSKGSRGLASGARSSMRNTPRDSGRASSNKLSKTPSAKEISTFVDNATQKGKTSGAATREEMLRPKVGESQVSRLKSALKAREFLADQFPEIADDPNLTVQDIANTDIDNPQQAIDSIQRLDNYIRSILDQADEMSRSMRLQEDAVKRDEASKTRVEEMLNSLEDGDVEIEQGLRASLDKLNDSIASGKAKIEQDYAPIANRRDEMLQMASTARGFSRNTGRNKQQRTKGARAAANKRLISV